MAATETSAEPDWEQIKAVLDDSIAELDEPERDAIRLRFFERKPLASVGMALGISEDAARMRVGRAIDKLRTRLAARGITSTAAALSTVLAQNLVGTAPAALGARVVAHVFGSALPAGTVAVWPTVLKYAAGAVILALLTTVLYLNSRPGSTTATLSAPDSAGVAPHPVTAPSPATTAVPDLRSAPAEPDGLALLFIDGETGAPPTNHIALLKGWERGASLLVQKTVAVEQGRAQVPFDPTAGPDFRIYTHMEGYADVHLRWQPKRGEAIPELYTIRLIRPASIGGQVLDSAGRPVAGATVGLNTEEVTAVGTVTQNYTVDYLTVKTGHDGYWQLNRLAPEMVRHITGGASHPDYSRSESLYASRDPNFVQQLLNGTATFRLQEGIVVRGTVIDEGGRPVNLAAVRVGKMGSSQSRETRTAADGSFTVRGCEPGQGLVTVELEGYAPTVIALELNRTWSQCN
jgi:hypothetical protein